MPGRETWGINSPEFEEYLYTILGTVEAADLIAEAIDTVKAEMEEGVIDSGDGGRLISWLQDVSRQNMAVMIIFGGA